MNSRERVQSIMELAAPIGAEIKPSAPAKVQSIIGLAAVIGKTAQSEQALDMFMDIAREVQQGRESGQ